MKTEFRELREGETDLELLTLAVTGGAAAIGASWLTLGLPLPQCVFHVITGCPCPTCGATRCVMEIFHGHLLHALAWNPLVFCGFTVLLVLNILFAAILTGGRRRIRISFTPEDARFLRIAIPLLFAVNWAYEIHHGV